jgi:hypothetical protein
MGLPFESGRKMLILLFGLDCHDWSFISCEKDGWEGGRRGRGGGNMGLVSHTILTHELSPKQWLIIEGLHGKIPS